MQLIANVIDIFKRKINMKIDSNKPLFSRKAKLKLPLERLLFVRF